MVVVDPATRRIVAREKLGGTPDYVRWVAPLREIWVTEPGAKAIEMWRLTGKDPPKLAHGHHPLRDHRTRDFDRVRVAEPRNGEMAAEKAFFRRRDQPSEGGIGRLRVDGVAGMDAPALCIEDGK